MHFLIVVYFTRFAGCPLALVRGGLGLHFGGYRRQLQAGQVFNLTHHPDFSPRFAYFPTLPHFSVEISDKQRRIAIKPRQQKQGLGGKPCGELVNLCRYAVIWNESGEMGGEVAVGEDG